MKAKLAVTVVLALAALPVAPSAADPASTCPKPFTSAPADLYGKGIARDRDDEGDTCIKVHQNDPSKVNVTEDHERG